MIKKIMLSLIAILFISLAAVPLMAQDTGACCYEDGENTACIVTEEETCYDEYDGEFMGIGTDCTDADENGIADICEEPATGACCEYMGSWYCSETTQELCEGWEGIYAGDGTECYDGFCESLPGACCYGDGECAELTESECESEEYDGDFKGAGTDCYDDPEDEDEIAEVCEEPVYGACCSEDPMSGNIVCFELTEDECAELEGTYLGDNIDCIDIDGNDNDTSDICEDAPGACCLDDGSCSVMNALDCQLAGGEFKGADTDCYDDPEDEDDIAEVCEEIEQTGACCVYEGYWYCSETTQELCESWGAIYAGDGTECYDGLCEELTTGACCYNQGDDIECIETDEETCEDEYEGDWMGAGTECVDDDENGVADICEEPSTGACCYEESEETYCYVIDEENCVNYYNGEWMGEGTDCTDADENGIADACEEPATGACCYEESEETYCFVVDEDICINYYNGEWMGAGTDCSDADENGIADACEEPATGACCYEESEETYCYVVDEDNCINYYNGEWMGAGTDCSDADENGIADACEEPDTYEYLPGDANMAAETWPAQTIGGDVTYLVNYFRGLADPCKLDGFYASADATGDCMVVGGDVTYLVNYFRGLNDMNYCSDYEPAWPTPSDVPTDAPDGWPNCD